ncbi:MAG: hypothetical protein IT372_05010 [Polyangiaceae bacterium]|nr:hypothetical protein [Polyangiaceae bacterium]
MSFGMVIAFLFIGALFAIPIGAVIGIQYWRAQEHKKKQIVAWGAIAQQRGGNLMPARGSFSHHALWVPGPGQGVTVAVTNGVIVDAAVARELVNPGGWHTQVAAQCVVPSPNYVVHTHDGRRAAQMVPQEAMQWLPCLRGDTTIACGGRLVTVVMPGVVLDGDRIQGAIEMAIHLASRGPAQGAA